MANNSAVYTQKPSLDEFIQEWLSMVRSGTGERGIFNREAILSNLPERRDSNHVFGVNPCGEIVLRSKQFCNLSIVRNTLLDTPETLGRKVTLASILGTIQSTLTNFNYIHPDWKVNCEEERLLGVDITGQFDKIENFDEKSLKEYKNLAILANETYSNILGINPSTAVTCIKPSGNSAQLLNCSSGCHPRYSNYYIRRLRIGNGTPMAKFLLSQNVPVNPEVGQRLDNATVLVFDFPVKSPNNAVTRNDINAIAHLNYWKNLKTHYTEHNPSCTIYFNEDEVLDVAAWVWKNWDIIGGLSFLQRDGGIYQLAPYEEITKEQYEKLMETFPKLDFTKYSTYEAEDLREGSGEYACTGDRCEL
jgi:ribonucleoside-diphosphate reductase alpha chain